MSPARTTWFPSPCGVGLGEGYLAVKHLGSPRPLRRKLAMELRRSHPLETARRCRLGVTPEICRAIAGAVLNQRPQRRHDFHRRLENGHAGGFLGLRRAPKICGKKLVVVMVIELR